MPTTQQVRVVVGERSGGLQTGDTITIKGRAGVIVSQRELNKYMEVTLTDHSLQSEDQETTWTRKLLLDSEVNVLRLVLSDDELLAQHLQEFSRMVVRHWTNHNKLMYSLLSILQTRFHKSMDQGLSPARPFDFDKAAELAKHQESYSLWDKVRAFSEEGDDVSAVRAVVRVREMCRLKLTANYRNSLSRSSSVIGNLTEDLQLDAMQEFLKTTDWMGTDAIWEQVGAGQELDS
jgi:hypothetical protein